MSVGKTTGPRSAIGRTSGHRPAVGTTGPRSPVGKTSGYRQAVTTGPRTAITTGPKPSVDKAAVRNIPSPQRSAKTGAFPIVVAAVALLAVVGVIVVLLNLSGETSTKTADAGKNTPVAATGDHTSAPNDPGKTALPPPPPPPSTDKSGPKPPENPASVKEEDLSAQADVVASYLRQKSYGRARQRLDALDRDVPKNDPKFADWLIKIEQWRKEIEQGSDALAGEMLNDAQTKAEAGDAAAVGLSLSPPRLANLLKDDADRVRQETGKLQELAQQKGKERFQAAIIEAEQKIPVKLPPAPPKTAVFFGPEKAAPGIKWTGGNGSLCTPAKKLAYADGSQKLVFSGDPKVLGNTSAVTLVLNYTAAKEVEIDVKVKTQQFNWIGGTVKAPAGDVKTYEIPINRNLWKAGGREGRPISDVSLEFKGVQPGALQIFRIYKK
jgi:hypothetical protein